MTSISPQAEVFWTPERDATLKRMRAAGETTTVIAAALGTTRSACVGRAKRKGFETPNKPRKPINGEPRTYARRPKPAPKPKADIAAKRAKPVPPPPNKTAEPRAPRYTTKADARAILPGTNPVASIIEATGCKWPVGEYPHRWCNGEVEDGGRQPYCEAHSQMNVRRVVQDVPEHIGDVVARVLVGVRQKMDEARG